MVSYLGMGAIVLNVHAYPCLYVGLKEAVTNLFLPSSLYRMFYLKTQS
jgi:hypothetical protein